MNARAMSWLMVLALAGCTGFGPDTIEASEEPSHAEPLPEGLVAEPIAPQSPTTAIQRYRVGELAGDHALTLGRFVGLYALAGRAAGQVVGVAEVVQSDAREAELTALWVDLDHQRARLAIGEPDVRRFGAVLGNLTKRPGDRAPAHLDIGAAHGAQVGDLYVALSDDPTPREVGLLKVVALDDGSRGCAAKPPSAPASAGSVTPTSLPGAETPSWRSGCGRARSAACGSRPRTPRCGHPATNGVPAISRRPCEPPRRTSPSRTAAVP